MRQLIDLPFAWITPIVVPHSSSTAKVGDVVASQTQASDGMPQKCSRVDTLGYLVSWKRRRLCHSLAVTVTPQYHMR